MRLKVQVTRWPSCCHDASYVLESRKKRSLGMEAVPNQRQLEDAVGLACPTSRYARFQTQRFELNLGGL